MAVGEQADGQPFDQVMLPDNDLAEFVKQGMRESPGFLDCVVDCVDSGIHFAI